MSDRSLLGHVGAAIRLLYERSPSRNPANLLTQTHNLPLLPFDILLGIAEYLHPEDIVALKATCKSLREFAESRALWLFQAGAMLDMCHPLPLQGFQRVKDINTPDLSKLVRQGCKLHESWIKHEPKLIRPYTTISAPEHEDIVWLSPITSKYTLGCTKGGRVLCWDVFKRERVAEWFSGSEWEIWKCRVEFDEGVVYFAMARRVPSGIGTDCQMMALKFPEENSESESDLPVFKALTKLHFPGYVISVYLLDPLRRILTAYLWLESTNHLGLFVLLDWDNPQYVFVNTGISCDPIQREWSCMGYDSENVVIHAEEETRAYQFFYPYSFLYSIATTTPPKSTKVPRVPPPREISHDFLPMTNPYGNFVTQSSHFVRQWWPMVPHLEGIRKRTCAMLLKTWTVPDPEGDPPVLGPNDPPPGTHLFTIAQHYVTIPLRKEQLRWWFISKPVEIVCYPHAPIVDPPHPIPPAVFFAENQGDDVEWLTDVSEHVDLFTDWVDVAGDDTVDGIEGGPGSRGNTGREIEITLNIGTTEEQALPAQPPEPSPAQQIIFVPLIPTPQPPPQAAPVITPQIEFVDDGVPVVPLVAVDFGLAVWLEYVNFRTDEIKIRYAVFPSVDVDRATDSFDGMSNENGEGVAIHTLETPPEIDLRKVCHIGLDQAQGTIILGMRHSQVYILKYR